MKGYLKTRQPWYRVLAGFIILVMVFSGFQLAAPTAEASIPASKKIIVGYWHNFDNGSGNIRLRDVSPNFDVINVSFAEPTNGAQGGTIGFAPYNATDAEFTSDIQYLKSQGKKVIISIGGANGQVQLVNAQAKSNFVSSMKTIITKYGFNGLDVDFEGHSLYLNAGDSDFRSPTTPVITNLIAALRELHDFYGPDFMLTMAPETFFVQMGYSFYGGSCFSCDNRAGAYLPVIYGVRDILDWLQVQHYNSGSITGLDGRAYAMGNADFHVAMADMVLTGFPIAGNANLMFPALRPDQVVIGLPANVNAGGGFTPVAEVQKALDYLMKGVSYGGAYQLRNGAHPGMRGLMTWSINWDKFNNLEFSSNHRAYLDQFGGGGGDTVAPTAPTNLRTTGKSATSVSLAWSASTDNVGVTGYTVTYGSSSVNTSGTSVTVSGLSANTSYTFTVKARDAAGNVSGASNAVTVTTDSGGGNSCTEAAWSASAVYTKGMRVSYNGKVYEAQWWTQGEQPDLSGEWGVWRFISNCGGDGGIGGDTSAPAAPGNPQVTGKTSASISLSWSASTDNVGVTGYTVAYGSNTVNVSGTSVTISGLTAGTSYTFTIKAKDAAGNVSAGSTVQAATDSGQVGGTAWAAGVSYKVNDEVTYAGKAYICLQNHTSLQGWEPPNVPALWKLK